jgi:hypothetical protein
MSSIDQITDERHAIRAHLGQLDFREERSAAHRACLNQLHRLAADAETRLAIASPQEQRRVYELLQLRIQIAPNRTLYIQGNIPTHGTIHSDEPQRMISAAAPRDSSQELARLGFRMGPR